MKRCLLLVSLLLTVSLASAQLQKISIPAGTPEDKALQAASNEQDAQKKLAMYQDVLQQFASNPDAVAFANWQISQYYQNAGAQSTNAYAQHRHQNIAPRPASTQQ